MHAPAPKFTSYADCRRALEAGRLTLPALVDHYLDRIEATHSLNIYVAVYTDEVRARAAALQAKFDTAPGSVGRLFGLVISIKDVICEADKTVTGGSKILEGYTSSFSATAVARLLAEDAVVIGRVNCDEFGMGSANRHSVYGATRNPHAPDRIPGGSSGGSAAAVAADTCLASLGTDTGGSVRQPAAFCGVVGVKGTYGRTSRHGLLAYASSFDQIGTLTHSVADAQLLLEIMAGSDAYDATAVTTPVPAYSQATLDRPARVAYLPAAQAHPGMEAGLRATHETFLDRLRANGHIVEAVDFDYLDYLVPTYYVLTTAEASSNLSRYDGVRYGYRHPEATTVGEVYTKSRTAGFGAEVKRRILLGAFVLSAGYYDAYYGRAQRVRRLVRDRLLTIFEQYDFIALPVAPTGPWQHDAEPADPTTVYLSDVFTVLANLAGLPALSIPLPTAPGALPVGQQLIGRPFGETDLLAFAKTLNARG